MQQKRAADNKLDEAMLLRVIRVLQLVSLSHCLFACFPLMKMGDEEWERERSRKTESRVEREFIHYFVSSLLMSSQ